MKKSTIHIFCLQFLITVSVLSGCAHQPNRATYTSEGKTYGQVRGTFRHKWWNYYEQGLSFADGRFFKEAARDFQLAISKREKDQRMARTYGMHFVDYFPRRELGIVHYRMGNLEAAKEELSLSLTQYPTAKARFYLDCVRKGLIENTGDQVVPPRLTINVPKGDVWTNEDPVLISGTAQDESYLSAVTIEGVPLFMEGAQQQISFSEPLKLAQGHHTVEVEARNLMGKVSRRKILFHVDREGPIITVEELTSGPDVPGQAYLIQGSVYDESGVSDLKINGEAVPIEKGGEVPFVAKPPANTNTLEVVATDRLGNQTSARIDLKIPSAKVDPIMLASSDSNLKCFFLSGLFGSKDIQPPEISFKGWTDSQTVFMDKVYLDGHVADESNIQNLSINQRPIMHRKGKRIFFNHLLSIQKGKNIIIIKAKDEAGNVAKREIIITRLVPKALQLAERLSLTVLPFGQKGEISDASLSFQDNLIDALVTQNRFRVVEREKLEVILNEQKLSRSKLIERQTALQIGKLMAAQTIIFGNIIETNAGIEIVARMIDTETSEILAAEDVYDEIKDLSALKTLAEGMATKFHRNFPLLDGLVVQKGDKYVFTDIGQGKIRLQRKIIIYHEKPIKHPVTGKLLGADNRILGRARVIQVMPGISKAEMLGTNSRAIKPMDKVITE